MTKLSDESYRDQKGSYYLVGAVARIAGTSEQEIRDAIQRKLLTAQFMDNLGDYIVRREEVIRWVTHVKKTKPNLRRRVVIIDPDLEFSDILRLEFGRLSNLKVRVVAGASDILPYIELNQPDLILASVGPSHPEVVDALRKIRQIEALTETRYILYTALDGTRAAALDLSKDLGIKTLIDRSEGARVILAEARRCLGIGKG